MATPKLYVLGDDKVKAALSAVLPKLRSSVLRRAMREGAKLAAKRAKAKARTAFVSRSGLLIKAIKGDVTGGKRGKDPIARVRINPSISAIYRNKKRRPSAYAHVVEHGSSKNNAKPHPFMLDAFDDPAIFDAIKRMAQLEFKRQVSKRYFAG